MLEGRKDNAGVACQLATDTADARYFTDAFHKECLYFYEHPRLSKVCARKRGQIAGATLLRDRDKHA